MKTEKRQDSAAGGDWFLLLIFAILAWRAIMQMPGLDEFFVRLPNDSAMRLVVIRDLLGGQGWLDMSMPRLGPDTGFQIHWSRLIDGPIAGLIGLAGLVAGAERAEYLALTVWPLALFAAAILLAAAIGRRLGGQIAGLVAGLLVAFSFTGNRIFQPGAIDHHNVQLVLLMAVMLGLVGRADIRFAALGGLAMALSLAIGVETLPQLAIAGLAMALIWLARGTPERAGTLAFAAGLGLGLPALFLASAPPAAYGGGFCDGLSTDLASPVILSAAALVLVAGLASDRGFTQRLVALGALGAAVVLVTVTLTPACLSNPYDRLDPYLQERWLSIVTEAQSLGFILERSLVPRLYLGFYVLAVIAGLVSLALARRDAARRADWLTFAALLAASLVMALYQVRGTLTVTMLAAVPLATVIAALRNRWRETGRIAPGLAALGLLVACLPVTWWSVASLADRVMPGGIAPGVIAGSGSERQDDRGCFSRATLAGLAALPPGLISANSNLGAQLLLHTPHRVLAAPYHRNEAGMRAQLEISLSAGPDEAHEKLQALGADYVVLCSLDPELVTLAGLGYSGWGLELHKGAVPDFLQPIPLPQDAALLAYRPR